MNDSQSCKFLNIIRAGDAGLGNRRPNELGLSYKTCPWCISLGIITKLDERNEPALGYERQIKGFAKLITLKSSLTTPSSEIIKDYLEGDGSSIITMSADP